MRYVRYPLFLALFIQLFSQGATAQNTVRINDSALDGGQTYNWSKDSVYLLDGVVFLESGGRLNIEAGTLIQAIASPSNGDLVSMLIVTQGAQIYANGTAQAPIIMTSEMDDLTNPTDLDPSQGGLWGGLVVLGQAPIATTNGLGHLEGIDSLDTRGAYGGNLSDDHSGSLRYLSIRYGGGDIIPDTEISGLTLAGVGDQTLVEKVETYACQDDGFEILGGSVNLRYAVAGFCRDDAFDYDQGWKGKGQFWFTIQDGSFGNIGGEHDGAQPYDLPNFSSPIISNVTYIGSGAQSSTNSNNTLALEFRDASGGVYANSIFTDFAGHALQVEDRGSPGEVDARLRMENGQLNLNNNIWWDFENGSEWNTGPDGLILANADAEDPSAQFLVDHLIANENLIQNPGLRNICREQNRCLDPLLRTFSPALGTGTAMNDPWFEDVGFIGAFGPVNWLANWTALDENDHLKATDYGIVQGRVYFDLTEDCVPDAEDYLLPGFFVGLSDGIDTALYSVDAEGRYFATVSPGTYTLFLLGPENSQWTTCQTDSLIILESQDNLSIDLSTSADEFCASLEVVVSIPLLRRCFDDNALHLSYLNSGTDTATNVDIILELDTSLILAPGQGTIAEDLGNNTYRFDIGELVPGQSGKIAFFVEVSCDALLGQTHCAVAEIDGDGICTSNTSGAVIQVDVECEPDSIRFSLENVGDANMQGPENYIVIEDDLMYRSEPFQLDLGAIEYVVVPASGRTYRLETLRFPNSNFHEQSFAFVEGCGQDSSGAYSVGYIMQFNFNDADPARFRFCETNRGSYDPNDLTGLPLGSGTEHLISGDHFLDYRIRFQNTGTDTAFNIRIVDTLPEYLDMRTFKAGNSSHTYTWSLNDHELVFLFSDIMLPDSNVNEPQSNGFVAYRIAPVNDLSIDTRIENRAGIYFDFNDPILTNTTWHTIGDLESALISDIHTLDPGLRHLEVFPNPGRGLTTLLLKGDIEGDEMRLEVINGLGQTVYTGKFRQNKLVWQTGGLPVGVYVLRVMSKDKLLGLAKVVVQ